MADSSPLAEPPQSSNSDASELKDLERMIENVENMSGVWLCATVWGRSRCSLMTLHERVITSRTLSAHLHSAAHLDGVRHGGAADQSGPGGLRAEAGGSPLQMQSCRLWGPRPGARWCHCHNAFSDVMWLSVLRWDEGDTFVKAEAVIVLCSS